MTKFAMWMFLVVLPGFLVLSLCLEDVIWDLQKALGPRVSCVQMDNNISCGRVLK